MQKKIVAVIFGGRSPEHEVSIITGHQVMDALETAGFLVLPIYITKTGEWYVGQSLYNIKQYADPSLNMNNLENVYRVSISPDRSIREMVLHPSVKKGLFRKPPQLWADVFFPTIHGSFGEDGTLQGLLELADVPYVGSGVTASAIGMDKVKMKAFFREAGMPTLDCLSVGREEWKPDGKSFLARAEKFCSFPMMVKPVCLGSSIGVMRCANSEELENAIETALVLDDQALVERALLDFVEINCSVMGPPEQTSVCEQPCRTQGFLTFDDKYKKGGKGAKVFGTNAGMASQERIVPAPISPEITSRIQELSMLAFRAIGASGVARFDFLLETAKQELYLNEINTLPGALAFYLWEATGLPFDELVTKLVHIALERYRVRSATQFSFETNLMVS